MAGITQEEMRVLLKAQQGESEGAIMYRALADVVKDPKDREKHSFSLLVPADCEG